MAEGKRRKRRNVIFLSILIVTIFSIISGLAYFSYLKKLDADEQRDEVQERLYNNLMQQGYVSQYYSNDSWKAKHFFAQAVELSAKPKKENSAKLFYDNINHARLKFYFKHKDSLRGASLNKDESAVLSWSGDGSVKLWDVASKQSYEIVKHIGSVNGASFNKDESAVLSWSSDGSVNLWDVASRQSHEIAKHTGSVNGVSVNKDESAVLSWSSGSVKLWDIVSRQSHEIVKHTGRVKGISVNKDESAVLSWSHDGSVKLWDVASRQSYEIAKHTGSVNGASFNKDGSAVLSWSHDGSVKLYNLYNKIKLPKNAYVLAVQAETGTTLNQFGELVYLSVKEWETVRNKYDEIKKEMAEKTKKE